MKHFKIQKDKVSGKYRVLRLTSRHKYYLFGPMVYGWEPVTQTVAFSYHNEVKLFKSKADALVYIKKETIRLTPSKWEDIN